MPVLLGLFILSLFFALAPRFMKKLFTVHVIIAVSGYLSLRIAALVLGGGKGGRNTGILEEPANYLLLLIFAIPVVVGFGIVFGLIARLVGRRA